MGNKSTARAAPSTSDGSPEPRAALAVNGALRRLVYREALDTLSRIPRLDGVSAQAIALTIARRVDEAAT